MKMSVLKPTGANNAHANSRSTKLSAAGYVWAAAMSVSDSCAWRISRGLRRVRTYVVERDHIAVDEQRHRHRRAQLLGGALQIVTQTLHTGRKVIWSQRRALSRARTCMLL